MAATVAMWDICPGRRTSRAAATPSLEAPQEEGAVGEGREPGRCRAPGQEQCACQGMGPRSKGWPWAGWPLAPPSFWGVSGRGCQPIDGGSQTAEWEARVWMWPVEMPLERGR